MFIAMNRFKIVIGKESDFEKIWKNRETYLNEVPGFISFNLLRGDTQADHTLFASHSTWACQDDFIKWTNSESFRKSHKGAGNHRDLYIGHPHFEGFNVI
ncbi:MAG: antibiotic biosynthesis monooxygenase [Rhodospirillaceae bacterium]|nr:antibiotic biosynthesis monooxygenase [Rhodospirillaceae bacterium]|tara:strand:- start:15338 stop:15637 length:300 start_codon:yes stop_codon:yes gene_type:complete